LDTGPMPKKILRRSRNPRNNLPLRTLQSDEPQFYPLGGCLQDFFQGAILTLLTGVRA